MCIQCQRANPWHWWKASREPVCIADISSRALGVVGSHCNLFYIGKRAAVNPADRTFRRVVAKSGMCISETNAGGISINFDHTGTWKNLLRSNTRYGCILGSPYCQPTSKPFNAGQLLATAFINRCVCWSCTNRHVQSDIPISLKIFRSSRRQINLARRTSCSLLCQRAKQHRAKQQYNSSKMSRILKIDTGSAQ